MVSRIYPGALLCVLLLILAEHEKFDEILVREFGQLGLLG